MIWGHYCYTWCWSRAAGWWCSLPNQQARLSWHVSWLPQWGITSPTFCGGWPTTTRGCWTSDNFQTLHENAARHRIHEIKSAWASWLIFVPNFQCTMGKLVTFAIKSNKRVNIEQSDGRQIFAILSSDSLQYQGHILSFKARSSDVFNLWIICESVNVKAKYSHSNSQCYTSAGGGKWGASWRNQECGYLGEYSSRIFWRNLECGFKNCG